MFNHFCSILFGRLQFSEDLAFTYIIVCCLNAVGSVTAIVGNLVVLVAIKRDSTLLQKPYYLLLFNQAISDLGVGILAQPLYVAFRAAGMKEFLQLHCQLGIAYNLVTICFAWLSLLTITSISIDRFLAVHLYSNYRATVTMRRTKLIIMSLWLISILVDLAFIFSVAAYWIVINVLICTALVMTSFNYLMIYKTLYRHRVKINKDIIGFRSQDSQSSPPHGRLNTSHIARLKATVDTMLWVYIIFLACYVPYFCLALVINIIGRNTTVHVANQILITIIFINSSLNPILIYWRIPAISQSAKEIFRKVFPSEN